MIPIRAERFDDMPSHLMLHIGDTRRALVGPGDTIWVDESDHTKALDPQAILGRYEQDPHFRAEVDVIVQMKIFGKTI